MVSKVLLADDSATIQKLVEMALSDSDFDLLSVSDGKQAVDKLAEFQPDIILADAIMPHLDGYQVCEQVKNDHRFAHIPVILLTGRFQPYDKERADSVGVNEKVVKPFSQDQLVSVMRQLLEANAADQAAPTEGFDEGATVQISPENLRAHLQSLEPDVPENEDIPSIDDFDMDEDGDDDEEVAVAEPEEPTSELGAADDDEIMELDADDLDATAELDEPVVLEDPEDTDELAIEELDLAEPEEDLEPEAVEVVEEPEAQELEEPEELDLADEPEAVEIDEPEILDEPEDLELAEPEALELDEPDTLDAAPEELNLEAIPEELDVADDFDDLPDDLDVTEDDLEAIDFDDEEDLAEDDEPETLDSAEFEPLPDDTAPFEVDIPEPALEEEPEVLAADDELPEPMGLDDDTTLEPIEMEELDLEEDGAPINEIESTMDAHGDDETEPVDLDELKLEDSVDAESGGAEDFQFDDSDISEGDSLDEIEDLDLSGEVLEDSDFELAADDDEDDDTRPVLEVDEEDELVAEPIFEDAATQPVATQPLSEEPAGESDVEELPEELDMDGLDDEELALELDETPEEVVAAADEDLLVEEIDEPLLDEVAEAEEVGEPEVLAEPEPVFEPEPEAVFEPEADPQLAAEPENVDPIPASPAAEPLIMEEGGADPAAETIRATGPLLTELGDADPGAATMTLDEPIVAPPEPEESEPEPKPEPVAESADSRAPASNGPVNLSDEQLDQLADKVAKRLMNTLAEDQIREIVWQVVPELSEAMIKKRIYQLEQSVEAE